MAQHLPLSVRVPIEEDNPSIVRWEEKCIRCGMCKEACTNLMGVLGTYSLEETGGKAVCIYCGQCANVCPVDSIRPLPTPTRWWWSAPLRRFAPLWARNSAWNPAPLWRARW